MSRVISPLQLPWCDFPKAADTSQHGLLTLPDELSLVDFNNATKYRSDQYHAEGIETFEHSKILEMARVIAQSFAVNDPMNRHIRPPKKVPESIANSVHQDAFGSTKFGPWNTENLFYWFIRLIILTNTSDPKEGIKINEDMLRLSLAVCDKGKIIGGAFNITVPPKEEPFRESDTFFEALYLFVEPIMNVILSQEHEAMQSLTQRYPSFKEALDRRKVGMHFLIARSTQLPTEHTFELLAASAEHFQLLEYEFMVITATNQWTGAACELLGATRVHFSPFRDEIRVALENNSDDNEPYSADGYLSDKDSGMMFYVMKLA